MPTLLFLLTFITADRAVSFSGVRENSPPSIYGCTANSTLETRLQVSVLSVVEVPLPIFNLTVVDPAGWGRLFLLRRPLTPRRCSATSTSLQGVNDTAAMAQLPGNDLVGTEVQFEIEYIRTATDSLGSENSCTTQNFTVANFNYFGHL